MPGALHWGIGALHRHPESTRSTQSTTTLKQNIVLALSQWALARWRLVHWCIALGGISAWHVALMTCALPADASWRMDSRQAQNLSPMRGLWDPALN